MLALLAIQAAWPFVLGLHLSLDEGNRPALDLKEETARQMVGTILRVDRGTDALAAGTVLVLRARQVAFRHPLRLAALLIEGREQMFIGCQPLTVKAEGDGFASVYRARKTSRGWCFVQQDGTYLTPGIERAMHFPTWLELFTAVRERPRVKLVARFFVA